MKPVLVFIGILAGTLIAAPFTGWVLMHWTEYVMKMLGE